MVVGIEGMAAGEEKVLRCPRSLPALDAPSPSVCAAIQSQDRLPCASPPITQGECEEQGCCYNPSDRVKPCYYGNTVTVQCTPDGQFSLAVSRAVTLPPLILDSVHLASGRGAGCVPVGQNNAFILFRFPLSACGTTFQMAGDQGVYENELVASRDVRTWSLGSITRDSTFRCPYTGDNYRTQLVPIGAASGLPFPSHHQCFIVSTFTFMESASQWALTGPVYLHCSASVCRPSRLEPCTLSCPAVARGRRSSEQHLQDGLSHVTSQGPVLLLQARLKREVFPELGSPRSTGAAWILALAGVMLMGTLCVTLMAVMWGRWRNAACEISMIQ
ncbi:zona pellucida sperm-binding protein 4-like isoform X3 [Mauremys mutica]|nr:zona pellucida sperm-binding protein 4-like isoform X3 [Mauremys mutica]XP_044880592.1 zona pellucida sperm-binding protein 4-like isoform X3 [Mauremys mutica]XP_044880593.1 zona pellucida sperm-binding protein 4-like isoform X3 [Mauremys mutica]XP_044880594.1 zona pellucida sperm-binding protein 4-like isoform X3 [Mauremys mutica]